MNRNGRIKAWLKKRLPRFTVWVRLLRGQRSETGKCRKSLAPFCTGDGIDVGYGGDPIVRNAICMDMPNPYAGYRTHPQHLHGDARCLSWFCDGSLDFVYSSHVLEDFEDTSAVLNEWLRVLKPGGHLVLFLPDEPTYRKHCSQTGQQYNTHHVHADFGLSFVKRALGTGANLEIVHERFPVGIYSFELVLRKSS
jgi:SAM-dependent methyltransferase